jgi:hypothetical protein
MKIEHLIARYPRLYHMAEVGSWDGIRKYGLLSTAEILSLLKVPAGQRSKHQHAHRPTKVRLEDPEYGVFILRDQKPMNDERLRWCLTGGLTPTDWYALLNGRVFFWVSLERLQRLLGARAYRSEEHDVLTIDAGPLIRKYVEQIHLTHINTGNTFPYPAKRGLGTFKTVADYGTRRDGATPSPEVVELVVDAGVPDISEYVLGVDRMRGAQIIRNIYKRQ